MRIFLITFEENAGEYEGQLRITCDKLKFSTLYNDCVFYADGVRVKIDERIISIEEIDEDGRVIE